MDYFIRKFKDIIYNSDRTPSIDDCGASDLSCNECPILKECQNLYNKGKGGGVNYADFYVEKINLILDFLIRLDIEDTLSNKGIK